MNRTQISIALALIVGCASATHAGAQSMKPGLWEITSKMGGNPQMEQAMAQMEKQMAAMPPAQRKQMQEMMEKQGVSMGAAAGGGIVSKTCISKEMVERNQLYTPQQHQGNCTSNHEKTATGFKLKYTCTNPASSGEGVFTFTSDTAYSMKMNMNGTQDGKPQTSSMEANGKWMGGDCGTLKPLVVPK